MANSYGIMEGSTLKVGIVEALDLFAKRTNPFVTVTVSEQKKSTRYIPATANPVWNEELNL